MVTSVLVIGTHFKKKKRIDIVLRMGKEEEAIGDWKILATIQKGTRYMTYCHPPRAAEETKQIYA